MMHAIMSMREKKKHYRSKREKVINFIQMDQANLQ